jgi:hypothetical protein
MVNGQGGGTWGVISCLFQAMDFTPCFKQSTVFQVGQGTGFVPVSASCRTLGDGHVTQWSDDRHIEGDRSAPGCERP